MEKQKLEERKILTANQMIGELLIGIVLFGLLSYVIYRILYSIIANYLGKVDNNFVLLGIIVVLLQVIMVFVTFTLANRQALKRGTIYKKDVKKVIANVSIVIIAILLIQAFGAFTNVSSVLDEVVKDNFMLNYKEGLLSSICDDDEMAIYQIEKEKAIKDMKNQLYLYVAIVETGIFVIYGLAIFLEKKYIYQKAE